MITLHLTGPELPTRLSAIHAVAIHACCPYGEAWLRVDRTLRIPLVETEWRGATLLRPRTSFRPSAHHHVAIETTIPTSMTVTLYADESK